MVDVKQSRRSGLPRAEMRLPTHRFSATKSKLKQLASAGVAATYLFSVQLHAEPSNDIDRNLSHLVEAGRQAAQFAWAAGNLVEAERIGADTIGLARTWVGGRKILPELLAEQGIVVQRNHGTQAGSGIFREALAIAEDVYGPNDVHLTKPLYYLALNDQYLGHGDEALRLVQRAIDVELHALGSEAAGVGTLYMDYGFMQMNLLRYKDAETSFVNALKIQMQHMAGQKAVVLNTFGFVVECYIKAKDLTNANMLLNQLYLLTLSAMQNPSSDFERDQIQISYATFELIKSEYFLESNQLIRARVHVNAGLQYLLASKARSSWEAVRWLDQLSEVEKTAKNWGAVAEVNEREISLVKDRLPESAFDFAKYWSNVARARALQNRPTDAAEAFAKATRIATLAQNRWMLATLKDTFTASAEFFLELSAQDKGKANEYVERAFEDLQWSHRPTANTALTQARARDGSGGGAASEEIRRRDLLVQDAVSVDAQLLRALGEVSTKRDDHIISSLRGRAESIKADIAGLDASIAAKEPLYSDMSDPKPVSTSALMKALASDEAVIFIAAGNPTVVFLVTSEGVNWAINRNSALNSMVVALRCSAAVTDPSCSTEEESTVRGPEFPSRVAVRNTMPMSFDFDLSNEIYQELFPGSLSGNLAPKKRVYIAADGVFATIPFQMLVTAPEGDGEFNEHQNVPWFVNAHSVSVLPSPASLLINSGGSKESRQRRFLGVGNPELGQTAAPQSGFPTCDAEGNNTGEVRDRDNAIRGTLATVSQVQKSGIVEPTKILVDPSELRSLVSLPSTECELKHMADDFGADSSVLLLGANATVTAIKSASESGELAEYDIIAFATHGLKAGEVASAQPALVLTPPSVPSQRDDGLLTSEEISQLRINADWVILSACNTAAGDKGNNEGFSGLARAFFYAGAKTLLVSYWPVRSSAAVQITTGTISTLLGKAQVDPSDALRSTMMAMIRRGFWHPSDWAALGLVGGRS